MLYQYINEERKVFNLAPHNNFTIESENIFTTIVGQNGTGKSRLLTSLIEWSFVSDNSEFISSRVLRSYFFTNRIAISISPFDRFPSSNMQKKYYKKYTYLGLKDLRNTNLGRAYISKIITSLMESLHYGSLKPIALSNILNYLGYKGFIELEFQIDNEWKHIRTYWRL